MSVATSSIPHRKPSAGRAGCSGSLHRKLVEGRAGNQRCEKKDRTQETLLALRAWTVSAGSGRLGAPLGITRSPPPGLLGKGAPALSGEGRPTECALRRGRYYRGLARQSRRSMLAACKHDLVLCLAGRRLLARGSFVFSEI